jgi:cell division protein ZapA
MSRQPTVAVEILDKEYQVACPPDQEGALLAAARHLDQSMRDIRASGKVIGLERVAIMAALNLSHELLALRDGKPGASLDDHEERIEAVNSRLDEALYQLRQLEIS